MRKISKLEDKLVNFDGTVISIPELGLPEITIKSVLLKHVGSHKAKDGEEAINALCIGQKIAQANGSVALEEAEYKLLMETLKEMKFSSLIMGQVYKTVNDAPTILVEGAPEPGV